MDVISRQQAIKKFEDLCYPVRYDHNSVEKGMTITGIRQVLDELPPAPSEREKDEWVEASVAGMPAIYHRRCNTFVYAPNGKTGFNFCPNCGIDMRGGTKK